MNIDNSHREMICRMQYMAARGVLNDLNTNNIRYAVVKGCPLAYYKTGDPKSRISGDIDLLISREDIRKVTELMDLNGFETSYVPTRGERVMMVACSHQLLTYTKTIGQLPVEVDVNFDMFWGEYTGKRIDISDFLKDTVTMNLLGCEIKTLPPLKAMIQIILHHYKEMNSLFYLTGHHAYKKRFFEDVYFLCKRYPEEISVQKLYAISSEYDIIPYVYYLFYYTKKVYNDDMLDAYLDAFRTDQGEELLNCYGLTKEERKTWGLSFGQRLDSDVSEWVFKQMTEQDREKLALSRKLFGFTR